MASGSLHAYHISMIPVKEWAFDTRLIETQHQHLTNPIYQARRHSDAVLGNLCSSPVKLTADNMQRGTLARPTAVKPGRQVQESENQGTGSQNPGSQCQNPGNQPPGEPERSKNAAAALNMDEFCAFLDSQTERAVSEGADLSDFYNQAWHSLS